MIGMCNLVGLLVVYLLSVGFSALFRDLFILPQITGPRAYTYGFRLGMLSSATQRKWRKGDCPSVLQLRWGFSSSGSYNYAVHGLLGHPSESLRR